jgi:hypothetical protein
MIILALIAALGILALGVLVGMSAGTMNRSTERPIVIRRETTAVVIALPRRTDIRA